MQSNTNFPYYHNPKIGEEANKNINLEIMKYAGIYLLKKMSIDKEEGGITFEVPLNEIDDYLEPILDDLLFNELIEINVKKANYEITDKGYDYIDKLILETEGYLDKYEDFEPKTRVAILKRDRVNPLRVRFLWGLYDGEFDDFDKWQDNFDIHEKERIYDWRFIITKKDFYDILFEEINDIQEFAEEELDTLIRESKEEREKAIEIEQERKRKEEKEKEKEEERYNDDHGDNGRGQYYYSNPHYFNPLYDPLFWFIVF